MVPAPGADDREGVQHVVLDEGDTILLSSVDVRYSRGKVRVTSDDTTTVVPDVQGPVHVLVDGPVVEVCTGTALVGLGTTQR